MWASVQNERNAQALSKKNKQEEKLSVWRTDMQIDTVYVWWGCSNIHSNTRAGRNRQVSLESKPKPLHWTYYRHLSLRTTKQLCTHICLLLQCSAAQVSVTVWRSVNEVLKENTFLYKALKKAPNHAFIIIIKGQRP